MNARLAKDCAAILLFAILIPAFASPASADVFKRFDFDVDGVLPSSDPEVVYVVNVGGPTEEDVYSIAGGLLLQDVCPLDANPAYYYPNNSLTGGGLTPEDEISFEVRVRFTEMQNLGGAFFQAFDGQNSYSLWFSPSGAHLQSEEDLDPVSVDLSQFHVYRIESAAESDAVTLFIDGELMATGTAPDNTKFNGFDWAGGAISTDACSDAEWDYLEFRSTFGTSPTETVIWSTLKSIF